MNPTQRSTRDETSEALDHYCPGCFKYRGDASQCLYCGYDASQPRSPLFLPHYSLLAGQFVVGRALGEPGGFGITYLAWDQVLRTPVAIKEYLPRELAGRSATETRIRSHTAQDEDLFEYGRQRFLEEARTLAKLQHPNVVRVRHVFSANATSYLVMDYYRGENLEQLRQRSPDLNPRTTVEVMLAILDGLRHVHGRGFLHRDVKPANIYLADIDSGNQQPILLDFGSARVALGERSRSMDVILTQGYAPIEQYNDQGHQGPWTDVYAVAATLYWLLTGHPPVDAISRLQDDPLVAPAELVPEIPAALSDAVMGGLGVQPEERPQSTLEFQEALIDAMPEVVEASAAAPVFDALSPVPQSARSWQTAAVAGTLTALVSLALWFLVPGNQSPLVKDDHWSLHSLGKTRLEILDNDRDEDNDPLRVVQLGRPLHGRADLEVDGSVTYTPAPTFKGSDRFSYRVTDGTTESRGEVTVQVESTQVVVWDAVGGADTERMVEVIRRLAPGRSQIVKTSSSDPQQLQNLLQDSHSFIVPPQLVADEVDAARQAGQRLAPILDAFVRRGGRVLAWCDQGFLDASGLLALGPRQLTASGGEVVLEGEDPLLHGLVPSFDAAELTCSYQLPGSEARVLAHLNGRPVIAARSLGQGQVVLGGFSFSTDYRPMGQILVNGIFGSSTPVRLPTPS